MADPDASRRLYQNARREALIVVAVWAVAFVWSVSCCYLEGYQFAPDWAIQSGLAERRDTELDQVAGFPVWVWYGIVLPWIGCTIFTILFAVYGMSDDDLGAEAQEQEAGHGH